jgi:starch synthase
VTACLYYHPEAYTTSGPKLMGRNAAGESFLRGFLAHSTAREFWVQVQKSEHARHFAQTLRTAGRVEPVQVVETSSLGALARAGVVYHPGPGIAEHAHQRSIFGAAAWSLCGVTHTTSSAGAMDALVDLLTAPVQPWDALICTSSAVKDNVVRLLQAQADYLKERLGISKLVLPQLPVIPLGIHTSDYHYSDAQKARARAALGASADTLVVLFVGRLSFHAKAHPLAMYQALEIAQRQSGKEVVLIECGWHANEFIKNAYADAARLACPSVRVVNLDGRLAEAREIAWAGADVFCSLSDNIQETFGITPLEAMAASLPVVISDWDGYKDTVRDGVDGFRIPSLMPRPGLGTDLAQRHALQLDNYDMYCGHSCMMVAVDVQAAALALGRLFDSAALRQQMGRAGRERVVALYDWAVIIPQYEALWAQLNAARAAAQPSQQPAQPWPARLDPFLAFASYPTQTLGEEAMLALVDTNAGQAQQRLATYRQLAMVNFAKAVLPTEAEIAQVLQASAAGPRPARELVAALPEARRAFVFRSLTWLVKLNLLRVLP